MYPGTVCFPTSSMRRMGHAGARTTSPFFACKSAPTTRTEPSTKAENTKKASTASSESYSVGNKRKEENRSRASSAATTGIAACVADIRARVQEYMCFDVGWLEWTGIAPLSKSKSSAMCLTRKQPHLIHPLFAVAPPSTSPGPHTTFGSRFLPSSQTGVGKSCVASDHGSNSTNTLTPSLLVAWYPPYLTPTAYSATRRRRTALRTRSHGSLKPTGIRPFGILSLSRPEICSLLLLFPVSATL